MRLLTVVFSAAVIALGVIPLRLHFAWRAAIAAAAFLVAGKYFIFRLLGCSNAFAPDLPRWFLHVTAWLYSIEFFWLLGALLCAVLHLALRGVLRLANHPLRIKGRILHNRINLGVLAAAFLLSTVGLACATTEPRLRKIELSPRGSSADPAATPELFTIAVLTDLHVNPATPVDQVRRIVERCNALEPDLVAILGDNVDGTVERCGKILEPLAELRARYGVLAVSGNHEYYSDFKPWWDFFTVHKIPLLINEVVTLPNGVAVAGIPDPAGIRFGVTHPDLAATAAKLPPKRRAAILLAHQPRFAREAAKLGFDLQLSGHTHGGMVIGFDRLIAFFNGGFVSGFYRVGNMTLYVSNGTGIWNGFPIRIGRPPEITLVTLRLPK